MKHKENAEKNAKFKHEIPANLKKAISDIMHQCHWLLTAASQHRFVLHLQTVYELKMLCIYDNHSVTTSHGDLQDFVLLVGTPLHNACAGKGHTKNGNATFFSFFCLRGHCFFFSKGKNLKQSVFI